MTRVSDIEYGIVCWLVKSNTFLADSDDYHFLLMMKERYENNRPITIQWQSDMDEIFSSVAVALADQGYVKKEK